jgi:hypothetical protein
LPINAYGALRPYGYINSARIDGGGVEGEVGGFRNEEPQKPHSLLAALE